jgi:hypothetical protein
MAIPAGYNVSRFAGFIKQDGSGPVAINGGGSASSGYSRQPSGFWVKNSDGSGPYIYDVVTGVATLATALLKVAS